MSRKYPLICVILTFVLMFSACSAPVNSGSPDNGQTAPPVPLNNGWDHEAAITRFLTAVNVSGTITPDDELVPPGTLPSVENIPQPDQSLIGSEVAIFFADKQQPIPFHYIYNSTTGEERLAVVIRGVHIPMLILFETNLGGPNGLFRKIADQVPFHATILAMINTSNQEGMYTLNATRYNDGVDPNEMIVLDNLTEMSSGEYLGVFGTAYDENNILISNFKGTLCPTESESLRDDLAVFWSIYDRFSITDLADI